MSARSAALAMAAAALIALPVIAPPYMRYVAELCLVYSLAALGLNFVVGLAGMYSLGQGAFMLIGAYVAALSVGSWNVPAGVALLLAPAFAVGTAAIIGLPVLRVRGLTLAILTFGFALVIFNLPKSFAFTGGPSGLFIRGSWLADAAGGRILYGVVAAIFVGGAILAWNVGRFSTGRALRMVGANEIVARSLGVDIFRYQLAAFALSAAYAGLAGALLALVTGYVAPEIFGPELSINLFAAVIIGGAGTLAGPILGACFIVLIPEVLGAAKDVSAIIYSIAFLLVAILFPRGFVGLAAVAGRYAGRGRPARGGEVAES